MWIKSSDGKAFINSVYLDCISLTDECILAWSGEDKEEQGHWILFRGIAEEAQKYYDWLTKKLMIEEASKDAAILRQPPPPLLVTANEPPPL